MVKFIVVILLSGILFSSVVAGDGLMRKRRRMTELHPYKSDNKMENLSFLEKILKQLRNNTKINSLEEESLKKHFDSSIGLYPGLYNLGYNKFSMVKIIENYIRPKLTTKKNNLSFPTKKLKLFYKLNLM